MISYDELKEKIDNGVIIFVSTSRAKDRITDLLINLLYFEMISRETFEKAMDYTFKEKEW